MAATAEIRSVRSEATNLAATRVFGDNSEFDLLVACCAGHEHADRIRDTLSRPLDWERMLRLVDHHRVVPQVFGQLSALSHLIPAQQLNALRSRYQDNARKALWFTAELIRITSHLESAGIKALPYKGPLLAQALYGEVTQRQFSDLDILILPADVSKAKAALLALGYKPGIEVAPHQERANVTAGYESPFHGPHAANLLELQWRILPRFYSIDFNVSDLIERADEINLGGRKPLAENSREGARPGNKLLMRTLCPEDLLLVLCVHAAKHVWVQLSWLCDIAQLAKSPQLDWSAIQDEARRLGIERIVNLNLLLAHKLLGAPLLPLQIQPNCHSERSEESAVPGHRKNADFSRQEQACASAIAAEWGPKNTQFSLAEDPSTTVLADEILRVIESSALYNTESLPYFRLMMRLRERRQDQARFLWRLAVTPSVSEWSAVRLPKPLQPLYRLVRLSRLAKRLASAG